MKLWKKLNKGLLLTVIVVMILAIYFVSVELQRKKEKVEIDVALNTYYDFVNKYELLPKSSRKNDNQIAENDYNKYLDEVEKELKSLMVSNEEIVKAQMKILKSNMDEEMKSDTVIVSMIRKILKVKKYSFKGEQVTVSVNSLLEREMKSVDDDTVRKTSDSVEDTITLKKENGTWKMVYSNLTNGLYGINSYGYRVRGEGIAK